MGRLEAGSSHGRNGAGGTLFMGMSKCGSLYNELREVAWLASAVFVPSVVGVAVVALAQA